MCEMCKPAIGTGYVLGMPQDCNLAKRLNEVKPVNLYIKF